MSEFYRQLRAMSQEKIKILFVCMGNICRSPTAQGAFQAQIKAQQLADLFEIDSAGTHAYHVGEAPDSRAQQAAKARGVDLSAQRARQVAVRDFAYFDYLVAMDAANLADLSQICPEKYGGKLSLMLDNIPDRKGRNVPDPYFEGKFDEVFSMLEFASEGLLLKVLKNQGILPNFIYPKSTEGA